MPHSSSNLPRPATFSTDDSENSVAETTTAATENRAATLAPATISAAPALRDVVSDDDVACAQQNGFGDAMQREVAPHTSVSPTTSQSERRKNRATPVFVGALAVGGIGLFASIAHNNSTAKTTSVQTVVHNAARAVASPTQTPTLSTQNQASAALPAKPNASTDSIATLLKRLQTNSQTTDKKVPSNGSNAPRTPYLQNDAAQNQALLNTDLASQNSQMPNSSAPNSSAPNSLAPNGANNGAAAIFDRAIEAQKAGRNDQAISIYRQLLQENPNVLSARVNLALLLLQAKRPGEALPELQAARKIDTKNPSLPWQIAQTLAQLKRPKEALEPLQAVVKLAPRDAQGRGALAQLLSSLGKPDEALEQWKALAAIAPQSPEAAFQAGNMAASSKKWDEAATWLRRAKTLVDKLDARDPRPTLQLARVLAQSGKTSEAQTLLESGAKRFPKVVEIGALLAQVRFERGDKSGAVEALQNLLPQVPAQLEKGVPRARLYAEIARLQENRKKPNQANDAWLQATKLLPRDADLRAFYAASLQKRGDKTEAVAQFRRALQIDARRNDLRLSLARALFDADKFADADIEYSKLLKAKPSHIGLLAEQAQVLEKQKNYDAALANWKRIETAQPNRTAPKLQSARLLQIAARDNDALAKFRQVLKAEPRQPEALLGAAELEEKAGKSAEAVGHWRALIATRPNYFPAYEKLLDNATKARQTAATADFLRPILARQPENAVAYDAVLRAFDAEEKPEIGRAYVQIFIKKFPKAVAPQRALTRFDLRKARSRSQTLKTQNVTSKAVLNPTPKPPTSSTRTLDAPQSATPRTQAAPAANAAFASTPALNSSEPSIPKSSDVS